MVELVTRIPAMPVRFPQCENGGAMRKVLSRKDLTREILNKK